MSEQDDGRDSVARREALEPILSSGVPPAHLLALTPSLAAIQADAVQRLMPRFDTSMVPALERLQASIASTLLPTLDMSAMVSSLTAMQGMLDNLTRTVDMSAMVPGLTAMQGTLNYVTRTVDMSAMVPSLAAMQATIDSLAPKFDVGAMVPGFAAMQASLESLTPKFDLPTLAPAFAEMSARLAALNVERPLAFDELVTLVDDVEVEEILESVEALSGQADPDAVEWSQVLTPSPAKTAAMVCALTVVLSGRFWQALIEHSEHPDPATLMMWAFALVTGVVYPSTKGAYSWAKKREEEHGEN